MTKKVEPPFIVLVDNREQCVPPWPPGVQTEPASLSEGDYSTHRLLKIGVVERKGGDFVQSMTHDRERFERELVRLQSYRFKCIIVENDLQNIMRESMAHPHSILGSVAAMFGRWDTPVLFAGNASSAGRLIAGVLRRWDRRVEEEQLAAADALEKALVDSMPGVVVPSAKEAAEVDATAGKVLGP